MKKHFFMIFIVLCLALLAACVTTGGHGEADAGDGFAGKNWNAPSRNNMYDRWEFGGGGSFHFWHVHEGKPLDRGVYRYEAKDGTLAVWKEDDEERTVYAYVFSDGGKTVTLTPAAQVHGTEAAPKAHSMGALPEEPVTFRAAR
jgi:hypothetical protein